MVSIYCIEDINNLKYIGSTKQKLKYRLGQHKYNKKLNHKCSSSKLLDLDDCKIYQLEECDESNRKEREQYWLDNTECVNKRNTIFDVKESNKQYYQRNNEYKKYKKEHMKQHYQKNKEHMKEDMKQRYQENKESRIRNEKQKYHYQKTWGGCKMCNNNLLKIDLSLFD